MFVFIDAQQQQELDRVKMEKEIESLQQQLSAVTSLRDVDDVRSQLHKTERDREKMLEHINVRVNFNNGLCS